MKTDPARFNMLAAVAAEVLCKDRTAEEISELIRFLNLLCTLAKTYL